MHNTTTDPELAARHLLARVAEDCYTLPELGIDLARFNDARAIVGLDRLAADVDECDSAALGEGWYALDFADRDDAHVQQQVDAARGVGIQHCPFCGCEDVYYNSGPETADSGTVFQVARCERDECDAEWAETYTFTGIYVRQSSSLRATTIVDVDAANAPRHARELAALWMERGDDALARGGDEPDGVEQVEWAMLGEALQSCASELLAIVDAADATMP